MEFFNDTQTPPMMGGPPPNWPGGPGGPPPGGPPPNWPGGPGGPGGPAFFHMPPPDGGIMPTGAAPGGAHDGGGKVGSKGASSGVGSGAWI